VITLAARTLSLLTIAALLAAPGSVRAQVLTSPAETAAFRQLAAGIPPGSRVKVETREGHRLTATLMAVSDDGIVIKRESRVPEPALTIAFTDLTRLQLDPRSGFTMRKALAIGLAAGVGAILTLFGIAVAMSD
jgi:hypothetical protein